MNQFTLARAARWVDEARQRGDHVAKFRVQDVADLVAALNQPDRQWRRRPIDEMKNHPCVESISTDAAEDRIVIMWSRRAYQDFPGILGNATMIDGPLLCRLPPQVIAQSIHHVAAHLPIPYWAADVLYKEYTP